MTERDRFEYAWREEYPLHESTIFRRSGLNPDAYVNTRVQDGWLMWQSCSAAHSAGAQEPVAYTSADRLKRIAERNRHVDTMWPASMRDDGDIPLYAQPQAMTDSAGAQTHKIIDDGEVTGYVAPSVAAQPQPMPQTDAARELIEAAKDVLANGHQHDVGGGDVFLGTCDSTERLQRALAEIERLDRAKGE